MKENSSTKQQDVLDTLSYRLDKINYSRDVLKRLALRQYFPSYEPKKSDEN